MGFAPFCCFSRLGFTLDSAFDASHDESAQKWVIARIYKGLSLTVRALSFAPWDQCEWILAGFGGNRV